MGVETGNRVVLVNPGEIIETMKNIPKGKLITIVEICKRISKAHGVEDCCSLTPGIFIMTAANAVEEAAKEGKNLGIPYWRTLKTGGFLNEKFPGGIEAHKRLLESEGHHVLKRGNRSIVADYELKLVP